MINQNAFRYDDTEGHRTRHTKITHEKDTHTPRHGKHHPQNITHTTHNISQTHTHSTQDDPQHVERCGARAPARLSQRLWRGMVPELSPEGKTAGGGLSRLGLFPRRRNQASALCPLQTWLPGQCFQFLVRTRCRRPPQRPWASSLGTGLGGMKVGRGQSLLSRVTLWGAVRKGDFGWDAPGGMGGEWRADPRRVGEAKRGASETLPTENGNLLGFFPLGWV